MTIKPKAVKYRISQDEPLSGTKSGPDDGDIIEHQSKAGDAGGGGDQASSDSAGFAAAIDAIRREGLSGRQLRMARRLAQKHGLAAMSDFDAVRQLRDIGVDPFQRADVLEGKTTRLPPAGPTTAEKAVVPAPKDHFSPAQQAFEVQQVQREIVKRRRRRIALLFTRLIIFVFLPTFLAGWYFYKVATPMYATNSEFLIQQSNAPGATSLGGLFSGTGFATSQDSITVQSYLNSRDAMFRLDKDLNFRAHFSQSGIDDLQRLDPEASNEEAYKLYKKQVTIGYDPSEGLVKMEVVAADPAVSAAFSNALINYAEEQVDQLTARLRGDQMKGARDSFDEAESKMIGAQDKVLELQVQLGVLDPVSESSAVFSQVSQFEAQIIQKNLELRQLLDNDAPNQARVRGVKGDIARLEKLVTELRSQLTVRTDDQDSLAGISAKLRIAENDLATRTAMMQQSLQQLETARIEANRQVRYLSVGVSPVAPDQATYPRSFINTLLSFLIFAGLYLLASLTASILREQISG